MTKRYKGAAWVKQLKKQVDALGEKAAPWYCEWNEPDGTRRCKSCGPGASGKKVATALRDKLNAQMALGEYETDAGRRTTWEEFVQRYQRDALSDCRANSVAEILSSLAHFARVLKLAGKPVASITTRSVAEFVGKRRLEPGKKPAKVDPATVAKAITVEDSTDTTSTKRTKKPKVMKRKVMKRKAGDPRAPLSPATINKDLRHIKAALRRAFKWKYLPELPEVDFVREDERLPRYVEPEDFALIFGKCDMATIPADRHYIPGDWWRALLSLAYLTGWRSGEILALRWSDVNMETGIAMTRAETNKGRKDAIVALPEIVLSFLRPLQGFEDEVFAWDRNRKTLQDQLDVIQSAAGIVLPCNSERLMNARQPVSGTPSTTSAAGLPRTT